MRFMSSFLCSVNTSPARGLFGGDGGPAAIARVLRIAHNSVYRKAPDAGKRIV
jgi:hypothetical protein